MRTSNLKGGKVALGNPKNSKMSATKPSKVSSATKGGKVQSMKDPMKGKSMNMGGKPKVAISIKPAKMVKMTSKAGKMVKMTGGMGAKR